MKRSERAFIAILDVAEHPAPVAVAGRVPVKVSAMNGAIAPGDPITSSSIAGVGMKATGAGPTVGYALDHFDAEGVGTILVFVSLGAYTPPHEAADDRLTQLEEENADLRAELAALRGMVEELAERAD